MVRRAFELLEMRQANPVEGGGVGGLISAVDDVGTDRSEVPVGLIDPFGWRAFVRNDEAVGAVDLFGGEHDERAGEQ